MKRWVVVVLLAVILGGAAWSWSSDRSPSAAMQPPATPAAQVEPSKKAHVSGMGVPAKVTTKRRVDAKERERYRRYITKRIAEHQARGGVPPAANDNTPAAHDENDGDDVANDDAYVPSQPRLRTTEADPGLESLVAALHEDFIPLADECYASALERNPNLKGMLDINFEVIADEDIGGLVDSFEVGNENKVHDDELIECMRETALSTLFPPPEGTDRQGVRLTLDLEPDAQ